jgi:hypothetical protein
METTPPNPQAFPVDAGGTFQRGMSLRDYFATAAMQGIMSEYLSKGSGNGYWSDYDMIAKEAYQVADQMLKERQS